MVKRRSILTILIFSIIIICIFLGLIVSNYSSIKAKGYFADVYINDKGDMTIKEQLVMKYPEGYSVVFRDVIYDKNNIHPNDQAILDVNSFKVKVKNAKGEYIFDPDQGIDKGVVVGYSFNGDYDEQGQLIGCPPDVKTSRCESVFIHVLQGMESEMTFEYEYTILGAVTSYNDIAVLNWRLVEYFDDTIDKSKITIHLPNNSYTIDDFHIFGHGLYDGTVEIQSNTKVVLDIQKMRSGDFIEFRLLMPLDIVSNIRNQNRVNIDQYEQILQAEDAMAREANIMRIAYWSLVALATVLGILMIGLIIYIYHKYDREFTPSFDGKYYRDLPADYTPAEMSYLYYFRKTNDEDITATLLDLIRKKYLTLENMQDINAKKPEFIFKLNKEKDLNELKTHENHLINWFIHEIGDGEKVSIKQIEEFPNKYENARLFQKLAKQFVEKVEAEGKKHDFFDADLEKIRPRLLGYSVIPMVYILVAVLSISLFNLNTVPFILIGLFITAVYSIYVGSLKRRSVNGNNDYAKWKAFRTFLLEFSQIKDYPIPGIVVWEHYLVYATSLKIADKVMDQLKVKLPPEAFSSPQATYLGYGINRPGFYYGYTFGRISSSVRTARTNSIKTISAHTASNFSSGGGRGGGFSGGSSFGGGGGGFRSR